MTLRSGLLTLSDHKILSPRVFEGLRDTLTLLNDALGTAATPHVERLHTDVAAACQEWPTTLATAHRTLTGLTRHANEVAAQPSIASNGDAARWAHALAQQCLDALNELTYLAPWIGLPITSRFLSACPRLDHMPTLQAVTLSLIHI